MPETPAQCEHIKTNGVRCGSPALRGRRYCYFHYNLIRPRVNVFPLLEDANAIQLELGEVIRGLIDQRLDTKRAALMLYALQIASGNLRRVDFEPTAGNIVLEPPFEIGKPPQPAPAEQEKEAQSRSDGREVGTGFDEELAEKKKRIQAYLAQNGW
ncbi:MAG TPA: hypothetical protein VE965_04560 [Gammaproteobacteria bacterium]|nr:hypothetical protein [Gammaproteobacteria bacterium]